jgi:thioredoxin-like negative regulator of GroEL
MPIWNKAANIAMFFDICRIDTKEHPELSSKMNIIGVPTVWLYRNGKPVEIYNGPREVESIIKTVMHFCE